ncbi:MAG: repair protein RecN [Solirubrobacterales bacterium]|nr:repair protein RecN [Solirubrobacterales bacterium]
MLHELRIENLLLIERAELRLDPGLNVITGETGAGKTVLAHSLDLLMGGKARPQIVRPGSAEAYVEGVFALPEDLFDDAELAELAERMPDDADEIVLGRRVGAGGRTRAFIQGRAATAADLALLGRRLLSFYGQHEHRKLTLASAQLEILDAFAGADQLERRRAYRAVHGECTSIASRLGELRESDGARERDLDLLRFELSEIEAAAPDAGEESELVADRERLRHADAIRAALATALAAATGDAGDGDGDGAVAMLGAGAAALAAVETIDEELGRLSERVGSLALEAGDLATELRAALDRVEADPARLQTIEERLAALDRLKRKHGGSIEAVLEHAEHCRARVAELENADERSGELEAQLSEAKAGRARIAAELTQAREQAAPELSRQVAAELEELAMPGASLEVSLTPHPDGFGGSGAEGVELLVATNPGMPLTPLRETASGGELSRLMLALTGLGASGAGAPTLVFDEIDAGIGGTTARAVGERLRGIGEDRQLVCITHLPQVASLASAHFRIEKSLQGEATTATVERVEGEGLVAEICRMLGASGEDEAASRHARELLAAA